MFLKKIQISGFKSFADKVSLPLDRGITGIVGPNGSGKSNVIDAVRWVMGEQNARNLRGKIATDIIFSGSANRKSLSIAEVSLVFDNTEDSLFCPPEYRHEPEISLTRRLYIDGEREYLINRKPCRLKDIINFFSTTGLGGRSYSMIQQGQVDRILNAKPEEMREIIEEAAGTLVYKTRRDEALRKLTHTKENLSRIDDIVVELERQRESLQGQMEKAREWKDLSTNLEKEELALFGHNFHFFNDQLVEIDQRLVLEQNKEAEVVAEMSRLEARQAELQNALDAADPGLEGLRESVSSVREQIARAESIITGTDEKVESRKGRLTSLDTEIKEERENLEVIEKQYELASDELAQAAQKTAELQDLIESFQDQVDAVDEEALVYKNRVDDYEDELSNIERLLATNTVRCETINREREKISNELAHTNSRHDVLQAEIGEAKKQLDIAEAAAREKQQGLDVDLARKTELDEEVKALEEKSIAQTDTRNTIKEKYFDARAQFNSLQDVLAQSSDVADELNALRAADPESVALQYGLLTDYISFNDQASEISSRTRSTFEKWAERLVLEDFDALGELVTLGGQLELGRLPLALLSSVKTFDQAALKRWSESVDALPITDFLTLGHNAPKGLSDYLARVYILSGLQLNASDVDELPFGAIVFTSQGVYLNSQGDLFIGSSKGDASGLLTRKGELETLSTALKQLEGELAATQSDLDATQTRHRELRLELAEVDNKLRDQNQDVLDVLSDLQSAKQMVEHKRELFDAVRIQKENLEKSDHALVEELNEQGQARISLAGEQERITQEAADLREQSATIEDKRNEVFRQHEARKLEFAKVESRMQALKQSTENTKTQLDRLQIGLSRRDDEKTKLEAEVHQIKSEYETSLGEIKGLLARREVIEKELAEKREENAGILEELRQVDAELKGFFEQHSQLEKSMSLKNVEGERLRTSLLGIKEQALEKYHLEIATYEFERDPEYDHKKKSALVQRLRNKIENLGAINMMAIEEYTNLMERHDFISAQKDEVVKSINVLEDALEEIEETSKNKFVETYEQINVEFANLFPILFQGGSAHLALTMPEDPLNSGVEILARLPGKKLQRMTLLSGGEKALTAISLIFALLKTKPTPFCFLDEVDAPLDEANVGRYNRVLEALAERFQFIVITHNRRTMEVLDTLFGVTMQEPGVSKIVGVDMKKDLPEHLKKAFKKEESSTSAASAPTPAPEALPVELEARPVEGASATET